MDKWKVLASVFFISTILFASLSFSIYQKVIQPPELETLQQKISALERENAILARDLYQMNLSLEYYRKQSALYRERVRELEPLVNETREGYALSGTAELDAPAVRQRIEYVGEFPFVERRVSYEGVMMTISVEVSSGKGRVLVVTNPKMGLIFQDAANTAVDVAERYTGKDLSGSDVIFSVVTEDEIPAVDGPSAGALMTLLTIYAVEGKTLPNFLTMTGTIDPEGSIGEIGGIVEKAQAAKDAGKSLFLIPRENRGLPVAYTEERRIGNFIITETKWKIVDAETHIEENVGIDVGYVDTIEDIISYASKVS